MFLQLFGRIILLISCVLAASIPEMISYDEEKAKVLFFVKEAYEKHGEITRMDHFKTSFAMERLNRLDADILITALNAEVSNYFPIIFCLNIRE